jgi:hypothetical protein
LTRCAEPLPQMAEAGSSSPPPSLPTGWARHFSKSKQQHYFYHAETQKSVWRLEDVPNLDALLTTASTATPIPPATTTTTTKTSTTRISDDANFRATVHSRLVAFVENDDTTSLDFDPCKKDFRSIIHDEALDLGLISTSEGDDEARFVVVYKKGFDPAEEDYQRLIVQPLKSMAAASKRRKEPPPPPLDELQVLGVVKRDRRTIEQVEMEIRANKKKAMLP